MGYQFRCAECGYEEGSDTDELKINFCPACGQRVNENPYPFTEKDCKQEHFWISMMAMGYAKMASSFDENFFCHLCGKLIGRLTSKKS